MADDDRVKASTSGQPGVGCAQCWPATADDAWRARQGLVRAAELIDDFHLHVMLLACPACRQSFLSVFTEIVDWADGIDPQSWMLTPLTATEMTALTARGSELSEAELNTGHQRVDRPWVGTTEPRAWRLSRVDGSGAAGTRHRTCIDARVSGGCHAQTR